MKEDTIRKAAEKESIQQEKAEIDKIIALYNNAKTGNLHISNQENREIPFLIIGRQEDLNWCLSTVAQAASNPDVYRDSCNFNTSNDRQSGEYMNIEKWTIFKNKIWLIGAIEAGIDFYLTTHRCRNAAPICYYNHEKNFSIYKYIEHIPVDEMPSNMGVISKHLNDFRSLGMTYNDTVGSKNFFMLKPNSTDGITNSEGFMDGLNNKEWISVDNDHVTYSNILQPLISEYCSSLPNAMQMFF